MDNMMGSNYDGHKPVLVAPIKVFTCKYCGRKFLNSRALGGHQNAHKKERTIWMMGVSSRKSLGMETHSLFREPVQEELSTGEAIRSFQRIADSWRKQKFKEGADQDSGWPGSFHVDSSGSNGQDTEAVTASSNDPNMHDLDLDLHL